MKKTLILIGITVVLLGGGILGSLYVMHHKQPEKIARIYQQDNLLYEIDLSTVKKSYTLTIDGENGAKNVILVEPNQISVCHLPRSPLCQAGSDLGRHSAHRLSAEPHSHFHCI